MDSTEGPHGAPRVHVGEGVVWMGGGAYDIRIVDFVSLFLRGRDVSFCDTTTTRTVASSRADGAGERGGNNAMAYVTLGHG